MRLSESTAANPSFKEIAERFEAELPLFERLACVGEDLLREGIRKAGIPCEVKSRAKDLTSFLGKILRKKRLSDPFTEIHDRAGIRATVLYSDFVPAVRDVVRDTFEILSEEDKEEKLGASELGYLGVHFDARLKSVSGGSYDELSGLVFEVQVHTRGQGAWAEVSHDLLYKTEGHEPPKDMQRRVNRAQVLTEIFDDEVNGARQSLLSEEGYLEARILSQLEPHFLRLTTGDYNRALSMEILHEVCKLLSPDEVARFAEIISGWIDSNRSKLEGIFEDYEKDSRDMPLISQPEVLLLFNRLDKDPFALRDTWIERLPADLLGELSTIWGSPIDF